jgi:hypothetical protein
MVVNHSLMSGQNIRHTGHASTFVDFILSRTQDYWVWHQPIVLYSRETGSSGKILQYWNTKSYLKTSACNGSVGFEYHWAVSNGHGYIQGDYKRND